MYEQKAKKKEDKHAFRLEKFKRVDGVISKKEQYQCCSNSTINEFGLWFLGKCHKEENFREAILEITKLFFQ